MGVVCWALVGWPGDGASVVLSDKIGDMVDELEKV